MSRSKGDSALKANTALKDMEKFKNLLAPISKETPERLSTRMNEHLKSLKDHFIPGADSHGATLNMPGSTNGATTGVNAALKTLRDTLTGKTLRDIIKSLAPIEKEMNEALETLKNHLEK